MGEEPDLASTVHEASHHLGDVDKGIACLTDRAR
jgi:hypothetical protein